MERLSWETASFDTVLITFCYTNSMEAYLHQISGGLIYYSEALGRAKSFGKNVDDRLIVTKDNDGSRVYREV